MSCQRPNSQLFSIGTDNGLAPKRWQAIIWTNDGLVQRHISASLSLNELIHWGRVTHKCVGTNTNIGSDNGLSPGRRQAIIWTNVGILLIGPLGTKFSEILIKIIIFSFKKMRLKVSSGKWRPFYLGLNVLRQETQRQCSAMEVCLCTNP